MFVFLRKRVDGKDEGCGSGLDAAINVHICICTMFVFIRKWVDGKDEGWVKVGCCQ